MKKKVFYAKKIHTNVLVWISYSFLVFAKPYPHHFAADCYHVEYRYYQEQNQSQSNGGTHGSFLYIGIKGFYKIHVIITDEEQDAPCHKEHHHIENDGKPKVGHRHIARTITYEQEVLQLGGVLLYQKVDAEHQDIETEHRDNQT